MGKGYKGIRFYGGRGLSLEEEKEKEQEAAKEIGSGYMRGTLSIVDVVSYLEGFHWPMTYTEVREWILKGVTESIVDNTAVECRKQPVQDKQEVKAIYSRKIRHINYDHKPWGKPVLKLTKEDLEDSFRWMLEITMVKRSN